jgi:hypothetical protein
MLKMLRQLKVWQQRVKRGGGSPVESPTQQQEEERRMSVRAPGRPVDDPQFYLTFRRILESL